MQYDRSLTPTKNIGLPDSLLSRFDLLFIVLDQMDPDIDRHISDHVLRMHRYRSTYDGGKFSFLSPDKSVNNYFIDALHPTITGSGDGTLRYGREDEVDGDSSVFVKYNRMLHGRKTGRGQKHDTLTIKFLKKYIHYAKHRIQPELTDEVRIVSSRKIICIHILQAPLLYPDITYLSANVALLFGGVNFGN